MRAVLVIASGAVLVTAGCGGGGSSSGSIPIKTIKQAARTQTFTIPSSSMEPTLHCARPAPGCEAASADRVVVEEPVQGPKRGDVLIFQTPPLAQVRCGAGGIFIKRVIGLPSETVSERDGIVYIDGKELKEPYVTPDRRDHGPPQTWHVPEGEYFLLGDNRAQSCDSRVWGSVPSANLIGKVVQIQRHG